MKMLYWLVGIVVVLGGGFYALNNYIYNEKQGDSAERSMKNSSDSPVQVFPISHATAVLRWGDAVIYTDPTGGADAFKGQPSPTIVFVTDIHGDHFDADTLTSVIGTASLIVPQAVKELLPENLSSRAKVMKNGETIPELGFQITTIPMYNIPESEKAFHTKGRGNGYVVEKDLPAPDSSGGQAVGFRVYIAGDTSGTPEMRALTNIDIAFVPMNLPYTMSVDEAADAVLAFKPKQVYPYHYRGPDGLADIGRFKELVNAGDPNIEVILLNWYQ